jgi:hypothetical protein
MGQKMLARISKTAFIVGSLVSMVGVVAVQLLTIRPDMPQETKNLVSLLFGIVGVASLFGVIFRLSEERRNKNEKEKKDEIENARHESQLAAHRLTHDLIERSQKDLGEELKSKFPFGYILFGNSDYKVAVTQFIDKIDGRKVRIEYNDIKTTYKYSNGKADVAVDGVLIRIIKDKSTAGFNDMLKHGIKVPLVKGEVRKLGMGAGTTNGTLCAHVEVIEADIENPVFCFGYKISNAKIYSRASVADN